MEYLYTRLEVGGRRFILLPKLNAAQSSVFSSGLKQAKAEKRSRDTPLIHLNEAGFCWSSQSIDDWVAPLVPSILALPKERIPAESLVQKYATITHLKDRSVVRFKPRIEASWMHTILRSADSSGLSPDEHHILFAILKMSGGECEMLTDFAVDGSKRQRKGTRMYYLSRIPCDMAAKTLRSTSSRSSKSTYLPRSCAIELDREAGRGLKASTLAEIGSWSGFSPA